MDAIPTAADLRQSYRYWRQQPLSWREATAAGLPTSKWTPRPASDAVVKARADFDVSTRRYPDDFAGVPGWHSSRDDKPATYSLQDDTGCGAFRVVGTVVPETYGSRGHSRNGHWKHGRDRATRGEHTGWFTDPYGDYMRDGDGLCWGVVLQLPGRNGESRFVAGYQFGGCDGGPTVDLARVFVEPASRDRWNPAPADYDAASEAARYADDLAKDAAEREKEYRTAWRAGSDWAAAAETIADCRRQRRALTREMRAACHLAGNAFRKIRTALKERLAELRAESAEAHQLQTELAAGNHDPLYFYPDDAAAAAFNDGAGQDVLKRRETV